MAENGTQRIHVQSFAADVPDGERSRMEAFIQTVRRTEIVFTGKRNRIIRGFHLLCYVGYRFSSPF